MAISADPTKVILAGDGSTDEFQFGNVFDLPAGSTGSDVFVDVVDNLGNVTRLDSNYAVNTSTGYVHYPNTGGVSPLGTGVNFLPAGWQIVLSRVEELSQNLDLTNQGNYSLPAIEAGMDYIMMCLQQMQEQINRATLLAINNPDPSAPVVVMPTTSVIPFYEGTYAAIKVLAALDPTQKASGYATDLNGGQGQYVFYTAIAAVGDAGWIAVPVGIIGG
jgi:hypothetical protein